MDFWSFYTEYFQNLLFNSNRKKCMPKVKGEKEVDANAPNHRIGGTETPIK